MVRDGAARAPRNDEPQIIPRFYLPFIWRPWRRHEFEASLMALLKPSLEGHTHASFHARFTCRHCAHLRPADGFAVDGPDRPARRQIRQQDGSGAEMAPAADRRWRRLAKAELLDINSATADELESAARASATGLFGQDHRGPSLQGQGRTGARRTSCRRRPTTRSRTRSSPSRRSESALTCSEVEVIASKRSQRSWIAFAALRNDGCPYESRTHPFVTSPARLRWPPATPAPDGGA